MGQGPQPWTGTSGKKKELNDFSPDHFRGLEAASGFEPENGITIDVGSHV
jgi:hypothetical protein